MDDILQVEYEFYLCHLIILMPIGLYWLLPAILAAENVKQNKN